MRFSFQDGEELPAEEDGGDDEQLSVEFVSAVKTEETSVRSVTCLCVFFASFVQLGRNLQTRSAFTACYFSCGISNDQTLESRTLLTAGEVTELLEVCSTWTYFTLLENYDHLTDGVAMGSPF